MIERVNRVARLFGEKLAEAKAELKGEARSQARLIKQASDIDGLEAAIEAHQAAGGPPRPIRGALIRMKDGKAMAFYGDGSLRHAAGHKPGKAARKVLKRMRRK